VAAARAPVAAAVVRGAVGLKVVEVAAVAIREDGKEAESVKAIGVDAEVKLAANRGLTGPRGWEVV